MPQEMQGRRKHLTVEAEQWCRERIAQHNDNLRGWREPHGFLIPTEPDEDERRATVRELIAARDELIALLVQFCGSTCDELECLGWRDAKVMAVPR